jgi:ABC-type amino acid transport system permease subunit
MLTDTVTNGPASSSDDRAETELLNGLLSGNDKAWREFHSRFDRLIYRCITKVTGRFSAVVSQDDIREIYATLIVQLLFWFNIAYLYQRFDFGVPFGPSFFSFDTKDLIGPMSAAVLGLALHQAAYAAEIVRSGIIAVDHGQLEAAAALGIPRLRQFRRIVLPQAMRSILPNAANEVISLFKGTSVVSVMAIGELFYQAQVIYGRNARVVALLSPGNPDAPLPAEIQRQDLASLHGNAAMDVLARRLNHIEHAARKVARLAARPVLENI